MYLKYIFNLLKGEDYAYYKANEEISKFKKLYIEQSIKLVNLKDVARSAHKMLQQQKYIIAMQNKRIKEHVELLEDINSRMKIISIDVAKIKNACSSAQSISPEIITALSNLENSIASIKHRAEQVNK